MTVDEFEEKRFLEWLRLNRRGHFTARTLWGVVAAVRDESGVDGLSLDSVLVLLRKHARAPVFDCPSDSWHCRLIASDGGARAELAGMQR